jgi:hypothetical protein
VGKIAVLVVGVVDRTDSERQEQVAVELARLGERRAVQIPRQPEADKECTVASQGVAVAVALAETAPAVHVAAAVAVVVVAAAAVVVVVAAVVVVVAAAVAAIGSFVSHHSRNWHTGQTAQVEGAVVRAPVLGRAQMAIEDCRPAALEAELLPPL